MVRVKDIFHYLSELAPLELQMDFDNSGMQAGHIDQPVSKAVLALDVTRDVIEEAAEENAQLIISHHPLIFGGIQSVCDSDPLTGSLLLMLIEKGIAAISMHTNLDIADGGVNDVLLCLLGAEREAVLDSDGCGRIGTLASSVCLGDFLTSCASVLHTKGLRFYDAGRPVRRIAVMGGSGGGSLRTAFEKGCDTYVTADVKYNQFLEAAALGINLIDGDHFGTEDPVIPELARKLREKFPETDFMVSKKHKQLISFFC